MIYLDHNSATMLRPGVLDAMHDAAHLGGNASSVHALGRRARQIVEAAVDAVRRLVGATRAVVIFTSGGAEANALGLWGMAHARRHAYGQRHVVASTSAHPSVEAMLRQLAAADFVIERQPEADFALGDDLAVAAVLWADRMSGRITAVADWTRAAAPRGVPVHLDAAQVIGKLPVCFDALNVATLALSGPQFGAPQGVGALIVRHDVDLVPLWGGGGQHAGLRPGTEPVALLAGLTQAAHHVMAAASESARIRRWRDAGVEHLQSLATRRLQVVAPTDAHLGNTLQVRLRDMSAPRVIAALGRHAIIAARGEDRHVTFSLGWCSMAGDMTAAARALEAILEGQQEVA